MPKLSVVIITYNEEKNIGRCLESIKNIADDVVVVDSFSTDNTGKICRDYDVRFIQHRFEGYIEQKNWAITQAKYPHILSLDADEALSEMLKESIREVKKKWTCDGYFFNRLTNYCGKWIRHTSWYPARKLRMWDSRKGHWGGINPHDRFLLNKGATKKFLKGDLLHYSYYSINEHIHQINYFSSVVAKAYMREGRKAGLFQIVLHPVWRLFRDYFIMLGFLDGFYGLIISVNQAHETFLKYIKLRNLYREQASVQKGKICFINSVRTWGGGEKWHLDLSNRLADKGYEILLITNLKSELANRAESAALRTYRVKVANLSFLNPFKIIHFIRIFRKEKVKSVIINLSADLKVGGVAAKLAGVEQIVYRRGSAIPVRNTALNRFLYMRIVSSIIANSEETKRTLLLRNPSIIDPRKINVIYNGINLQKYDQSIVHKLYQKKDGEIILGNAGRLVKQKGHHYLINIASVLKMRGLKFKILIAGEGKLEKDLKNYARQKEVQDKIIFLGFIENMKSFMESVDIFVLTSLWEGFGYVIIEAMACYKPVVAFDISSNPELIRDNETGYLVKSFKITEFANKIVELAQNENLRHRMGQLARETVINKFTIDKSLIQVEDMINPEQKKKSEIKVPARDILTVSDISYGVQR